MVGLATHFNAFPCFYFIIFWLEAGARRGPVLYFCLLSSFVHSFTHMSDVAVRCSCGKNAGTHCLKEPKLCGNCCWPRCAEDSHGSGRRGTKRGSAGNKSAKDKRRTYRNESWMDASLIADVVQANPETMGYVRRSGYTIAQLTHKLWYLLQQPVGETFVSLELINKFPPRVLGVLEESLGPDSRDDSDMAMASEPRDHVLAELEPISKEDSHMVMPSEPEKLV